VLGGRVGHAAILAPASDGPGSRRDRRTLDRRSTDGRRPVDAGREMVRVRTCRDSDPVGRISAREPGRGGGRRSMSTAEVALLGALAGFTIFLGLPMGRVETRNTTTKTLLNGVSAGILAFLFVDILEHAGEVLEDSLTAAQDGASWGTFV